MRTQRAVAVLGLIGLSSLAWAQALRGIGFAGGNRSFVTDISADGRTAVGWAMVGGQARAIRWTRIDGAGTFHPTLATTDSTANAVSGDGSWIAGDYDPGSGPRDFVWTGSPGPDGTLTPISMGVEPGGTAAGISDDGTTVVGQFTVHTSDGDIFPPYEWSNGSGVSIELPGLIPNGRAQAASADGAVIVGRINSNPERGFWHEGGATAMLPLLAGSFQSLAEGVSADGRCAVGQCRLTETNKTHATRWLRLPMSLPAGLAAEDLGVASGDSASFANDCNGDGSVVVGTSDSGAMIWRQGEGMVLLSAFLETIGIPVPERVLRDAIAISNNGRFIAGNSEVGATFEGFVVDTCAADLNDDRGVDDADFVAFAAAYNVLDCADPAMPPACPSDLNGDGVVDDTDFVEFARQYDRFICP